MADEKQVTPEVTPTVTPTEPTAETPAVTPTEPPKAGKTFTQEQVDGLINSRFAREKAAFEKQLADQKLAIEQEQATKRTELEIQLAEKDQRILGYSKGILPDKLDEALVLANLKMQKVDGLTLEDALTQITQEYPNLVVATKNGLPVVNKPEPENGYWTEAMKQKYPAQWAAVSKNYKK